MTSSLRRKNDSNNFKEKKEEKKRIRIFEPVIRENRCFSAYIKERVLSRKISQRKKLLQIEYYLSIKHVLRLKRLPVADKVVLNIFRVRNSGKSMFSRVYRINERVLSRKISQGKKLLQIEFYLSIKHMLRLRNGFP